MSKTFHKRTTPTIVKGYLEASLHLVFDRINWTISDIAHLFCVARELLNST